MKLTARLAAGCLLSIALACNAAPPATRGVPLFDGRTLGGWREIGDARWSVEPDASLLGRTGGGAQSFLATEASFADFTLELELRVEDQGNSGVQIRSRQDADGRVRGYQIEVDPSSRAWSGGLYEEAGRGWLHDLSKAPQARAAFRAGEWNHYRIEARGPRIRSWVNGVAAADFTDRDERAATSGFIALQVHSGQNTRVRWRNLRVTEHSVEEREPPAH